MSVLSERLWRVVPGVRRNERDRFLFFFILAALLALAEILAIAGSEALFLTRLGPEHLPGAFIMASLSTLAGSLLYAAIVGRMRNDRLFVFLLVGMALSLLLDAFMLRRGSDTVVLVLFCSSYLALAVFVSLHYWTFAADYFDTLSSKRVIPLLAAGASLGGMAGGILAVIVSRTVSGEALIVAWAIALLAAAAHVRSARARLLRWMPVGTAEADESSVSGLLGAVRYIRRSRMFAWLVVSVVGMVFSLTLMQYLYLDIFSRSFDTAEKLAAFFGIYLAVTNGIELLVSNVLTPWLIRRFGVAQANLAHPLFTLATFVGLAVEPSLWIAMAARANRELLDNALAGPVRALSYNALPRRFRGRMRALLEGVVFYAAMSIAGVALLALGQAIEGSWLALVGGLAALVYAGANLFVRREYLRSLVEQLRQGRLDLRAIAGGLDSRELGGLVELWENSLQQTHERYSLAILQLANPLVQHGFGAAVKRYATHGDPRVRLACIEALASQPEDGLEDILEVAIDDPEIAIRKLACRLVTSLPYIDEALRLKLRGHLVDSDLEVRAQTALVLGAEGHKTLREMLRNSNPEQKVAALVRTPAALMESVKEQLDDADPAVRSAVLDCLTRLGGGGELQADRLVGDLRHEDARVRRSAAAALASRGGETATRALANALDDVSRVVRSEAQAALASLGDRGVLAAVPMASGTRVWTADAALGTIAQAGGAVADALLVQFYNDRVREAWESLLAIEICPTSDTLDARFLRTALQNAHQRALQLSFRILELIEDPAVVGSIDRALELEPSRERADALEVLSNLGDRHASQLLALLLEDDPLEEKRPALEGLVILPSGLEEVLAEASGSGDRWLRLAANRYGQLEEGTAAEREIMERLLALQSVPLFAHLSLEQLEVINKLLQEVTYLVDEVIVREGEPGHELYVLVEGEVQFFKAYDSPAQEKLATMQPVGYFGEIAILDNEPRSVTVIASADSRLLTLAGARFKELILQAPEISFEVFPVLIARIRAAEARLTDLKSET